MSETRIPATEALGKILDDRLTLQVTPTVTALQFRGSISMTTNHPNAAALVKLCNMLGIRIFTHNGGNSYLVQLSAKKLDAILTIAIPYMTKKKDLAEKFLKVRQMFKDKELGKDQHAYADLWKQYKGEYEQTITEISGPKFLDKLLNEAVSYTPGAVDEDVDEGEGETTDNPESESESESESDPIQAQRKQCRGRPPKNGLRTFINEQGEEQVDPSSIPEEDDDDM